MPTTRRTATLLLVLLATTSCITNSRGFGYDPLPSWNPGEAKSTLLEFVDMVSDPGNDDYIAPEARVAVFDNDGTLWCEKPNYFQADFMVARVRERIAAQPSLRDEEPYRSFLAGTLDPHENLEGFLQLATDTHTGMLDSEFTDIAEAWLDAARHPRFERPYPDLIYQPMLELLQLLRDNEFQVWICTGGGQDFVRCFADDVYGVPPEQVIGTTVQKRYEVRDGEVVYVREAAFVAPINDKAGKPVNIRRRIGRTPVLAVGNSDGDIEMMRSSDDGAGPHLQVLIHHDDATREYDYDAGTERALEVAADRGWTVVSIAADFARVFPGGE